jgi:hypothetical protein
MAALHSLLALYGAFDQSVVEANDPGWTARVAQFLPATTGENQRGWFSEVKRLVDQLAPDVSAAQFPGVEAALDDLTAVANVISRFRDPLTEPSDNDPPLLTTTDIAQLLYIFAVGMMLAPDAPHTSVDFTAFRDPPGGSVESIMGLAAEPLTTIHRAAGRFAGRRTEESRREQAFGLMEMIPTEFISHRGWPRFMSRALHRI